MGIWTPIYYMVPWAKLSLQSKWHFNRFSYFCRVHGRERQTNWQIDRMTNTDRQTTTLSVTIGRIYVCSTVMQPNNNNNQAQSEYKHSLTFCVRRYVVIAMKPVHRLQICPIVAQLEGTPTIPQVTSGSVQ